LVLKPELSKSQRRVEGRPTSNTNRLAEFAGALNRWLPTKRHRLLWLAHWFPGLVNAYEVFTAARLGLGEMRPLLDAPGHYFDAHDYECQDQVEMPAAQGRDVSLIVGLTSLVMINAWDGWLIAEGCTDRIEFWEGNVLFYSHDKARLNEAEVLMTNFDCPRKMA
jgi:hypothetical protein